MTCVQFFRRVLRLTLTVGQTAFVAVAVDGELPRDLDGKVREAALEIFGDLSDISKLARRTVVAAMGRDSGKTQLGAGIGLYKLVTCDLSRVGPGDVATVAIVAPRERTARIALRRAIALVRRAPELRRRLVGEPRKDGFNLLRPDGYEVTFEVFAASRGGASLRGPSFIAVVFDESAQFRDESAAVNDSELYAAVMPRVLAGGLVLFLSTPWSEEGLFWQLSTENYGSASRAIVACASTLVMRDGEPTLAETIAVERLRDEENASREFVLAGINSFMAMGGSLFFDAKSIDDAIDDALQLPATIEDGERVTFGGDIGLVRDDSVLVGCGALGLGASSRLRVVSLLEKRPQKGKPLRLGEVIHDYGAEVRRLGGRGFMADGHAREPAREHAEKAQIEVWARPEGPSAKFDTHVALREYFRDRRIAIPRHQRLIAGLRAVTIKPVAGGTWKISSPRRIGQGHGDAVAALVLAAWSASNANGGLEYDETYDEHCRGLFRFSDTDNDPRRAPLD